jgi:hypothetical protein
MGPTKPAGVAGAVAVVPARVGWRLFHPVGERLESHRCEAIRSRPALDARLDDMGCSAVRNGYRRADRVPRFLRVMAYCDRLGGRQAQ